MMIVTMDAVQPRLERMDFLLMTGQLYEFA
jgi:hypothetical protein